MTTADDRILYSPHRLRITAVGESTSTLKIQAMPLYGPEEWFDRTPPHFKEYLESILAKLYAADEGGKK